MGPNREDEMRYAIPIVLWSLVAIGLGWFWFFSEGQGDGEVKNGPVVGQASNPAGTVIDSVPWKHLPDVDPFKLTDQNGDLFDSSELVGKPYVVSFFFASCPTFCRELNNELDRVNGLLKKTDLRFLTITVDPENDTPEVLSKYAEGYGADRDRWTFLTGQKYELERIGQHMFNVVVDRDTHTDNILLVDKWGRYRDRFKWDQPTDMKRFLDVAREVAAETEPPLDETVKTRNVLAGYEYPDLANVPWIRDFHLTERSGKKFFSRDLTGEVWIANFFFSSCPGICKKQNEYLRDLQKRLGDKCPRIVSMTTDPTTDTPSRLQEFAKTLNADPEKWLFCTGKSLLVKRIGSEFFKAHATDGHHSSQLYVVDRWGEVRGDFDWSDANQEIEMLKLVEQLRAEDRPQKTVASPQGERLKNGEEEAAIKLEADKS